MIDDGTKNRQTDKDLTLLGTACAFGFMLAGMFFPDMPPGLESTGTAFVMALGGALAARARRAERRRRQQRGE